MFLIKHFFSSDTQSQYRQHSHYINPQPTFSEEQQIVVAHERTIPDESLGLEATGLRIESRIGVDRVQVHDDKAVPGHVVVEEPGVPEHASWADYWHDRHQALALQ